MKLDEYIKQTLIDIVNGVSEAKDEIGDKVAVCVKTNKAYNEYPSVSYKYELRDYQLPLTVVGFKVLIQIDEKVSTEGKAEAGVLRVLSGSVNGATSQTSFSANEVTFSVPLAWKLGK